MANVPQFRLKGAEFHYPNASEKILKGIDLEIWTGEWVAVVGPNGSGKSTLLKVLSALLIPTQGFCFIDGADASKAGPQELRGRAAIVFQNPEDQIVASTVEEEAAFGPENLALPQREIEERIKEALRLTGLDGKEERLVSSLSGGQKQRLALAGALAMRPGALLLDEAMSMLDAQSRVEFTEIIRREHEGGMTIIEVTHRLEEIRDAQRVIVLDGGEIAEELSAADLFARSDAELAAWRLSKPPLERLVDKLNNDGLISGGAGSADELIKLLCL